MPGALSTYAFINAKIRARISLLLDEDRLARLDQAPTMDGFMGLLSDTEYADVADVFGRTGDLDLCELAIQDREYHVYEEAQQKLSDPPRAIVGAFIRRFEIENIKTALRIWFEKHIRNVSNDYKLAYLPKRPWPAGAAGDTLLESDTLETILERIRNACAAYTQNDLRLPDADAIRARGSLFFAENALDRLFFTELYRAVALQSSRDHAVAERLVGLQADIENLRKIARIESYYDLSEAELAEILIDVPGGSSKSGGTKRISANTLSETSFTAIISERFPQVASLLGTKRSILSQVDLIETVLEEELAREVRKILSGPPFTVGTILSYFVLKNFETRKIMSALNKIRYIQFSPEDA